MKSKTAACCGPTMGYDEKTGKGTPDSWQIDSWTRTIVEAMEIMNDPKKMEHVKKAMGKKQRSIKSFDELAKKIEEG